MYLNQFSKQQIKYVQKFIKAGQQQLLQQRTLVACGIGSPPPHSLMQQYAHHVRVLCDSKKLSGSSVAVNIQRLESTTARRLADADEEDLGQTEALLRLHSEDSVMLALHACQDHAQLLQCWTKNKHKLRLEHRVQSIMLLWEFYRQALTSEAQQEIASILNQDIVHTLQPHIAQMEINELSCCYLYLRKMHIPNTDNTLQQILIRALNIIEMESGAELLPLSALSRLAVGINFERDFFTPLVCRHFVPQLHRHILACNNVEQSRLLATCIFQLHALIDEDMLQAYKTRVRALLDRGVLGVTTPRTLLKVLHALNHSTWSHLQTSLIREILTILAPILGELEANDLKLVCRTFLHHQEPAALTLPLKAATEQLLQQEQSSDALACAAPFAKPQERDHYISLFKTLLLDSSKWSHPNASGHFFSTLRALKIADVRLCNTYWSGVVAELDASEEDITKMRFIRHCQRYMNFNNNLGGTYRHTAVEQRLSQLAMHAIEYDIAGRIPARFARLASFILAYGHTPFAWKKFPNLILSKILAMAPQLGINDCFYISRGIQIAQELRFRHQQPSLLGMQLSTIDSILIACAERHLSSNDELSATDLNAIVRTLSHRKSLKNTVVYSQALERYKQLNCNDLNSRAVRDMAYNFTTSNFFIPAMLESMFAYIEHNHAHVTGDTLEKVLSCAYNLGYTPKTFQVLDYAAQMLLRDFEQMSGLALVQACLALCYYKTIPEELINKVFCVKFIQRIEDEIQICYSKATYPERVLNLVMQLNRTVCLDFPEANVPWFQQNYVEAQLSKKPIVQTKFNSDVKELLQELLKDENCFRCNHTTPYGYQLDFVIHFDRDRKPIPDPVETTMLDRITKVAILLLKLDSFCENDLTALRGPESLKIKHLEMMGYKVLHINEHDWNSKYLNAPGAKANYLKCLLQITH